MTIAIQNPCWAQAFRPAVVRAMLALGQDLGLELAVPPKQTCCGLPAFEAGQRDAAIAAALLTLDHFAGYDTIVSPSASCLRMLREHIPALLHDRPQADEAIHLASRCHSWSDFLVQQVGVERLNLHYEGRILFYQTCHQQDDAAIQQWLAQVRGATILGNAPTQCCGFGNNLGWRHSKLSRSMADSVIFQLRNSGADLILSADVGCLLHLDTAAKKQGLPPFLHVAEFLAQAHTP